MITDGANGLQKIYSQFPFTSEPVLDWFHISMRVRYLEQIARGMRATSETEDMAKRVLTSTIDKLRWCFWHANIQKAESRLREILLICRIVVPEAPKFSESLSQLDFRTREFFAYVEANGGSTISYGKRHRDGRPISTAMAESAVNQILDQRMCKRQQIRWSPRGAHQLAQVRCAVINGDLKERLTAFRQRMKELPAEVAEFLLLKPNPKVFNAPSRSLPWKSSIRQEPLHCRIATPSRRSFTHMLSLATSPAR